MCMLPQEQLQSTHLTSMKNEFGLCTRRFLLCFLCSYSLGGLSRSMSDCSTYSEGGMVGENCLEEGEYMAVS